MQCRKTHYEILEVPPSASAGDIDAAYERLSQACRSANPGRPGNHADPRLHLIENAYWTLSDPGRRAFYDRNPGALGFPLQLSVEMREPRWSLQRVVLLLIGSVLAAGVVIQVAGLLLGVHRQSSVAAELQRERILLEERRQEYGDASAAEMAERKRAEAERREIQEKKQEEQRQARELEESRRYAERVSADLRMAEERVRREEEREQQRREAEEKRKQMEEERRLDRIRRGLH